MDHSEVKHLPKVDHTPAELDEASKHLLKAAAYMEKHGKSNFGYGEDAKCALMTIRHVSGKDFSEARSRFLARCQGLGYEDISDFNAKHSARKVIAALRASAFGL